MSERPHEPLHSDGEIREPPLANDGSTDPEAAPLDPPTARAVPPMEPSGEVTKSVSTVWPNVLGVLAIIMGVVWILGGVWAILAPVALEGAMGGLVDEQMTWYSSTGGWRMALLSVAVLSVAIPVMLLIGGINLVRRKTSGVHWLGAWSPAMIMLSGISVGIQYALKDEFLKQIAGQTQGVPGGGVAMTVSMNIGFFCGFVFNIFGPVFILIWFRRRKIREEVATWA